MRRYCLAFLALFAAAPAHADLTFCNETGSNASVAIGYKDSDTWTSEGWWTAAPGDCTTPVGGDLKNRYDYYRVTSPEIEYPVENYFFCTSPKEFTIVGDTECEARGHDRNPFNELDTGDAKDWTVTLTATSSQSSGGVTQQDLEADYQRLFNSVYSDLQGFWVDASDDAIGMRVEDVRLTDYYVGVRGGGANWGVADTCDGANNAGPVLIVTYDDFPNEPLCWVLAGLNADELLFRAIGGTGDIRMVRK